MEIIPLEGPVPFSNIRQFLSDPHSFTMFLNLVFHLRHFSFIQPLCQFISNLKVSLLRFLAFWDLTQILLLGLVDLLLQLHISKFIQVRYACQSCITFDSVHNFSTPLVLEPDKGLLVCL